MAPPTDPKSGIHKHSNTKLTTIDLIGGIYCSICNITYGNKKDYDEHYSQLHALENKSDIWYTCVVCRKDIHGYSSFRGHCYTTHVVKNRFKCQTCSKFFSKQSALDDHVATQHRFKCPLPCNREFSTRKELKLHQIVHKEDNGPPYPCQQCSEPITSLDGCQQHFDLHARFTYTCPICDSGFNEKIDASFHLTKHFVGEILQINTEEESEGQEDECALLAVGGILCVQCESPHRSRADFETHHEEEHGPEPPVYSCNLCGAQFPKYHQLAGHCYNHVTKHKFKCDTCGKSFPRLSILVSHARACDGSARPFRCARCPAAYGARPRYLHHLRTAHHLAHLHPCEEPLCAATFSSAAELAGHARAHGAPGRSCRACGLRLSNLAACERHLDVHRRPALACPVCETRFADKHRSAKHFAQHFTAVLHVCKTCGNVYNAKYRLAEHMKSHAETKRFECSYCGKGFPAANAYQQHLNTHTGNEPYKCVACKKTFKSYPNWSKHLRRMHDIDPKTVSKNEATKNRNAPNAASINAEATSQKHYKCELCDTSFMTLAYWVKHMKRTHDVDPKTVNKPDSLNLTDQNGTPEEAMSHENMSSDENFAESNDANTLEEAYMYVQSIASESSQNGGLNPSGLEADTEFIQEHPPTKSSINDHIDFFSNLMPGNSAVVADTSATQAAATVAPPVWAEYGPDFMHSQGIPAPAYSDHIIDLDDHLLPHIDPHLTSTGEPIDPGNFLGNLQNVSIDTFGQDMQNQAGGVKWEPPIITKFYSNYYDQMTDISANVLSVVQTNIY